MAYFKKGTKIPVVSGGSLTILDKLGEGGQGVVYKVEYGGKQLALKWYFAEKLSQPQAFYDNLQNNIRNGSPAREFLWPLEITQHFEGSFGYLMELRPSEYKDFTQFLLAKERFTSLEAMINAALHITNGFRELHIRGYSYQDLNDGNFFVNPKDGDVLICDNDNVAPYGKNLGIAGKCRYMAPEVVLGQKMPDMYTDFFSLAVVLYLMLFLNHPLEGARTMCPCLTEKLEQKIYGSDPLFMWDPDDSSNRPVRGVHSNVINRWPIYPDFVKLAFLKAFSKESMTCEGRKGRIMEKQWQEMLLRLRDMTARCQCGRDTFIDPDQAQYTCMCCGKTCRRPPVLKINGHKLVLSAGTRIYDCHISGTSVDFLNSRGRVLESKNRPGVYGMQNGTDKAWIGIPPKGDAKSFGKGEVCPAFPGLKVNFPGGNKGEII